MENLTSRALFTDIFSYYYGDRIRFLNMDCLSESEINGTSIEKTISETIDEINKIIDIVKNDKYDYVPCSDDDIASGTSALIDQLDMNKLKLCAETINSFIEDALEMRNTISGRVTIKCVFGYLFEKYLLNLFKEVVSEKKYVFLLRGGWEYLNVLQKHTKCMNTYRFSYNIHEHRSIFVSVKDPDIIKNLWKNSEN